jgi:uncharacterized protein YbjT (DUF2867 family)
MTKTRSTILAVGAAGKFASLVVPELAKRGARVRGLIRDAKPKARYAVVKQRFKNWTLPRLLPAGIIDAQLVKLFGLTKPQPASNGGSLHLKTRGAE